MDLIYMTDENTKNALVDVIKKSLVRANKQISYIGDMWKEDIFRYIIVQELEKKKIWGKLAPDRNETPRLILERRYGRKNSESRNKSKEIDIASIKTKKTTGEQAVVNPLAIEVKARREGLSWSEWKYDREKIMKYLNGKHGKYKYQLGVIVQGGNVKSINSNAKSRMSPTKKSNLLIAFLENGKPQLMWWHSKPVTKTKPAPKKRRLKKIKQSKNSKKKPGKRRKK